MFEGRFERTYITICSKFLSMHNSQPDADFMIKTLLKDGRKSIATIIDIKYDPIDYNYVERSCVDASGAIFDPPEENIKSLKNILYYNTTPVKYKVVYKFNPPDDDDPNDLVHEITLRYNPTQSMHIGDALPILYWINPENNKDVSSMPFPLPLDTIFSKYEIFYRKPIYHQSH